MDHAQQFDVRRSKHPWVGIFGPPKNATTFIRAALARVLEAEKLMFNIVDPDDRGKQLLHELDAHEMQARMRGASYRLSPARDGIR